MSTRTEQAERTRATILAAAEALIAERGFDRTSLQQVADRAGVTKANVYYYFRTKEALLGGVVAPHAQALRELVDDAAALPDPAARRSALITGYVEQSIRAFRRIGTVGIGGDPALRRAMSTTADLDAIAADALPVLLGPDPAPRRLAAWLQLNDLGPALRGLGHLPDPELQDALVDLCERALAS
ncbi:TetR/AcrR family transcriptional regulator [Tsukamurella tyrosinosolvens]|uniref:TetR/AcrR family transcriptional regulator n=1 Tax=Tsukamurella tyrosinosolvens TaxID=57704 RepID=UPI002DD43902|nr:helix-turn-helix domain-containing protein [Tsukamurella tyrosinosolvens]MEC4615724.1 helix-turn-helix domain-containing protein [Tsukamurella tyrosinosolvens]